VDAVRGSVEESRRSTRAESVSSSSVVVVVIDRGGATSVKWSKSHSYARTPSSRIPIRYDRDPHDSQRCVEADGELISIGRYRSTILRRPHRRHCRIDGRT
jgi:hypothetical protein